MVFFLFWLDIAIQQERAHINTHARRSSNTQNRNKPDFPSTMAPSATAPAPSSSSARPRGPPSDTLSMHEEAADGFGEDEVPRSSRAMGGAAAPKVEDKVGLLVQEHFEAFIEK